MRWNEYPTNSWQFVLVNCPGGASVGAVLCFVMFIAARDPLGDWALDSLAEWATEENGAPAMLLKRKAAVAAEG